MARIRELVVHHMAFSQAFSLPLAPVIAAANDARPLTVATSSARSPRVRQPSN